MNDTPLSQDERNYLIRRLVEDRVVDEAYAATILRREGYDIPVIIHDREILALYAKADARATEIMLNTQRPLHVTAPPSPRRAPWWMGGRRG